MSTEKRGGLGVVQIVLTLYRADVLSTVQSSMSAGQDPEQTLSRLMDWAEAREVGHLRHVGSRLVVARHQCRVSLNIRKC